VAALGQDQSAWCLTVFADTAQEAMKQNKTDDYDVSNAYPHWRPFFAMTGVSCHTGDGCDTVDCCDDIHTFNVCKYYSMCCTHSTLCCGM